MADTALNLLVENLLDSVRKKAKLIAENSKLQIAGLEDDFLHLEEEVQRLRALLKVAAQWQINSSKWKQLVNKDIRFAVHKAEDVIDVFAIRAQRCLESGFGVLGFLSIRRDSVRNLATKIDGLNEKVKEFLQNNQPAVQPETNSQELQVCLKAETQPI